jgi:uncharacterized protein HemX
MSEPFESSRAFGADETSPRTSAFVPILILALAMLGWFSFQSSVLTRERDALRRSMTAQETQFQNAQKLLDSLEALVRGTQQLSDAGNPGAKLIVDELKKRNISYTPNPSAPGATAPVPAK